MNFNAVVLEAELKTRSLIEQADHERLARQVQIQRRRSLFETAACFSIACRAGWVAYRNSFQAARQNMA